MSWTVTLGLLGGLVIVVWLVVWLLQKWAAKPNEWESRIPPQPPMQTEEMKPAAEPVKQPPILPPQKPMPPKRK